MLEASYIGNELTGTGFALAGVKTPSAPETADALWQLILDERERRQLVILSADYAPLIHERLMRLLESSPLPPVVVLPDGEGEVGRGGAIGEALDALGLGRIPE